MRQLVSVVTDDAVRYFVQNGDDVTQIAQTINPGFEVIEVIELGSVMTAALRLDGNGHKPKAASQLVKAPEPVVEVKPAPKGLTVRGTPRTRALPVARRSWGITAVQVLTDVREHPMSTTRDICQRMLRDTSQDAQQTVNNHLHRLKGKGAVEYVQRDGFDSLGGKRTIRHVRALDMSKRDDEPEIT